MYENIWLARDEKKPSTDAGGTWMGLVGIDHWLAEGGMDGKLVPIALISSMRVLMSTLQIVVIPMVGTVITVELVQQAPDVVAEPEHTFDDDERVEVRNELCEFTDSEGLFDFDGDERVLVGSWSSSWGPSGDPPGGFGIGVGIGASIMLTPIGSTSM